MSAGKVVTFAVAAYNAEKCLDVCLRSFVCEAVLERIEVLVVNDGSADGTRGVAQAYARRYPGVFAVVDQENRGHGGALNTAAALAAGKYFKAVDADDWVVTENLPGYVDALERAEADAVLSSYHIVRADTGRRQLFSTVCGREGRVLSFEEFMEVYDRIAPCATFHGIAYRTDFYRAAGWKLSERIFYEDNEYATVPMCRAEKVLLLPETLYQYRIGDAEQSVAFHNQVKRIGDIEAVIRRLLAFRGQGEELSPEHGDYFERKVAAIVVSYYAVALVKNPDKRMGREQARRMREKILAIDPAIRQRFDRKYIMLFMMNKMFISPKMYQGILDSRLYKYFRRFWSVGYVGHK